MKVFVGLNNVASVFSDLKQGFTDMGVDTLIVSKYKHESVIVQEFADFNIHTVKSYFPVFKPRRITFPLRKKWDSLVDSFILKKALSECDVFIFISDSFQDDFSDLKYIREQGKKIISVFVGDDVRWFHGMEQEFKKFHIKPIEYDDPAIKTIDALEERLQRIRTSEKYSDYIFSRLDQGQLQLRPYYRWNMMVNTAGIPENSVQRPKKPIIAHAPSNRSIKGTHYILRAFEELISEGYDFEVNLIENVPNQRALEMYYHADIVIDQLLCPGTGKLATEALASGAVVLANMSYDRYPQKNPESCPIVDVNPDTIKEQLAVLINNYELRSSIAVRGRPYVDKYLDIRHFCKKVVDLTSGITMPFDYTPDFFNQYYKPVSKEEELLLNQWTDTVKSCPWYSAHVEFGSRNGLYF